MKITTVSRRAERDIESTWDFFASDDLHAADRVRSNIKAEILRFATVPNIGRRRQDITDKDHFFWKIYSYLVYRYDETTLTVLRVIHGARDIPSILR